MTDASRYPPSWFCGLEAQQTRGCPAYSIRFGPHCHHCCCSRPIREVRQS